MTCWGGNLTKHDSGRVDKLIKKAGGVIGRTQDTLDSLYDRRTKNKLTNILNDETHPLRPDFDELTIARSGRFRVPKARTARYSRSFVPRAISGFNSDRKREGVNES